ncbi:transposable element Tcb2 transposase [Trichonephila clavipes]|nr:transposable element Tcb2 transposase [Trichonephila clavipes]
MGSHHAMAAQKPFFNWTMSQDYLQNVATDPWPAQFPDLSPTEHFWDLLSWRVGHLTSLNELEARIQQMWNEMSQDIIKLTCSNARSYRIVPSR